MESRQVTLLTKGYLAGWLDFDYKNPYSRLRESFILMQIEKDLMADALYLRTLVQSQYIPVNPKESIKAVKKVMDEHTRITLPYTFNQVKIDNDKTPEEWKALLSNLNKNKDGGHTE